MHYVHYCDHVVAIFKAPLAIAKAALRIDAVHLFVSLQNLYTKTRYSQKLSNLEQSYDIY